MTTFDGVWADLRKRLKDGTEIKGWSHAKGYTTLRFLVMDVAPGSITVSSSTMSSPRTIAKSDFARVYAAWPTYRAGRHTAKD
jgi:hypothetical protein